jgi:hypothetical protein
MFSFFVLILSLFIVHKPSQGGAFGNTMLLISLWHWNQGPTFIFGFKFVLFHYSSSFS